MKQLIISFFLCFSIVSAISAKITVPSIFSDNMVLQQNSEVAIWGWASPSEDIKIVSSWNKNDTVKIRCNNDAKWSTTIKTINAGGPYTIEIIGKSRLNLQNIMLGEVWLCSGQSNMEWSINSKIFNGEEEASKAANPNIRIFHIQNIGAEYPQLNCNANWVAATTESVRNTSAVGYFFARELQRKLNVPVGIIVAAWGGTPAEPWIEKSRIETNADLDRFKNKVKVDWWPSTPGRLYNSMIYPIAPYGIAGTIWYQGESNCVNHSVYSSLMKTLIENWRTDFKKEFPFYFVQIAPFDYKEKGKSEFLREQQEMVLKSVPKTGMVVISDLVDDIKNIHPKNKIDVGKRLANYALSETYSQNVGAYKSPMYESFSIKKDKITLNFSNVITGLKSMGKAPIKFMVADENRKFDLATAKIVGKQIVLTSSIIKNPVAVRFCFDDTSMPDVFSTEGLPLAPFRTDHWDEVK